MNQTSYKVIHKITNFDLEPKNIWQLDKKAVYLVTSLRERTTIPWSIGNDKID